MALRYVDWPDEVQRRTLHLAAGYVSPRYDQIMRLIDTRGNSPASSPKSGVAVTFSLQSEGGIPITDFPFSTATGELTIPSPLPTLPPGKSWPQVLSIWCEAKQGTAPGDPERAHVVVVVHQKLDTIWLTPDPLTVRKDASKVRFSILGKFSDGTTADLSNWSPMTVPDPADPDANPSSTDDRRFVHLIGIPIPSVVWASLGGGIDLPSNRTGFLNCTSASANATVTASITQSPILTATAKARGAPSWSERTLLSPVTPASTFKSMPKKKNVLILPDGFDGGAQAEFEFYARELVQRLGSEAQTRPHDLLKTKFNFFTAWVPSPQSDISVLTELMRKPYTGPKLPPGSPPAFDGDTFDPAVAGAIQLLVNERDTAFHSAFGTRPDDSFTGSQDYPGFNPLRIDTDDFNVFLHHVTSKPSDPSHSPEGRNWTNGGNDEKLILVLCRSTHLGGVNSFWTDTSRMMFVALQNEKVHRITPNAGGKGYETMVSTPDPAKAKLATWLTVAHELGHSLRLGDEYGKKKPPIKVFELPQIERWGNVQLLTSFSNKILSGDEIKWNWPRMAKAAAYKSLSQPNTQGIITLELAGSYAEQSCKPDKIRQGDFVRLRLRNIFFDDTISDELEVVSVEEFAIKVKALIGAPLPGQPFRGPIGSGPPGVVFVIATDKAGDEANLVHSAIRAHINSEHHPLDAPPGAGWTCDDTKNKFSGTPHVPPAPTPPVKWPANLDWIVGLYDGGGAYRCETYHPSSECMMLDDDNGKPFCQVCRYLLVDQIDPLKHGAIDRDFAPNYPK